MPSSADSIDNQKLISWFAVPMSTVPEPVAGSLVIFVMTWMDLIQLFHCRLQVVEERAVLE